jgi:hypothetical protein
MRSLRKNPAIGANMSNVEKKSSAGVFAGIALFCGAMSFLWGGLQGRRAGWEMLAAPTLAAVVCALIAIAIQRRGITYAGLLAIPLGVIGFLSGA